MTPGQQQTSSEDAARAWAQRVLAERGQPPADLLALVADSLKRSDTGRGSGRRPAA